MKVSIGVSSRHLHITQDDLYTLFGEGYELEKRNDLNQPGMFASYSTVTIKTDKSSIENVRILGPIRPYTQVEISKTDAHILGIEPPVRDSGDLRDAATVTIIGPKGEITKECAIIATRHIHLTEEHAKLYGLDGKDMVNVKLPGEKGGIITNVHLKVSKRNLAYFELHLDLDDANAHLIKDNDIGEIL